METVTKELFKAGRSRDREENRGKEELLDEEYSNDSAYFTPGKKDKDGEKEKDNAGEKPKKTNIMEDDNNIFAEGRRKIGLFPVKFCHNTVFHEDDKKLVAKDVLKMEKE